MKTKPGKRSRAATSPRRKLAQVDSMRLFGVVLATLNEAYKDDAAAIHALICNRVPCNKNLADHPTMQVELNAVTSRKSYAIGMLGVLNGVVERLTGERIAATFGKPNADGKCKLTGFVRYTPNAQDQPCERARR
jgi:hypothetical protein